jgi:copper homeostasis protein
LINHIRLEVCCGSYSDALAASGFADRIELNSALELGGLTPSRATFLKAMELNIPLAVMVRPRTAGFVYEEADIEVMLEDARWFCEHGASGIVFGFLNKDGSINIKQSQKMTDIIGDKEKIFHKAFDATPDLFQSCQTLIDLGITRILTGGGRGLVGDNLEVLAKLQNQYGDQIQLLPGGGVTEDNIITILKQTGITQIHMTAKETKLDPSTNQPYVAVSSQVLQRIKTILSQASDLV